MASKCPEKRSLGKAEDDIAQDRKRVKTSKNDVSAKVRTQPPQWNTLPVELRLAILEVVYENNGHDKRRALLATVSLEWRDFFESRNYRHLRLETELQTSTWGRRLSPDIEMLKLGAGGVSPRHVPMIRKISLEIRLNSYTCLSCEDAGTSHWTRQCNTTFRDALVRLFLHLSAWEYTPSPPWPTPSYEFPPPSPGLSRRSSRQSMPSMRPSTPSSRVSTPSSGLSRHSSRQSTHSSRLSTPSLESKSGLTLVLTAHTESDAGHWFRNYDFGHGILVDLPWDEYKERIGGERGYPDATSSRHGYTGVGYKNQSGTPARGPIFRLFSPLCRTLPPVAGIRGRANVMDNGTYQGTDKGKKKAGDVSTGDDISAAAHVPTVADQLAIHCSKVPIITSLVIPRQTRRYIRGSAMKTLWSCLPNLNHIAYEPWRMGRFICRDWDPLMASVIHSVPSTVKSLAIFEDFNEYMAAALLASSSSVPALRDRGIFLGPAEEKFISGQEYEPANNNTGSGGNSDAADRLAPNPLAEAFVEISQRLEFLSVGYMIDARHFFAIHKTQIETETATASAPGDSESGFTDNFEDATNENDTMVLRKRRIKKRAITDKWKPEPEEMDKESRFGCVGHDQKQWPNLKTLILTSPILTELTKSSEILTLLKDVSLAVRQMPRLEKLVIWYYTKGQACAFTYQVRGRVATLRWRGTWELQRDDELVEMWKKAVEDPEHRVGHQPSYLRGYSMETSVIGPGIEINSHGDAIYHLGLVHEGVLEEASLDQIRREGRIPNRRA